MGSSNTHFATGDGITPSCGTTLALVRRGSFGKELDRRRDRRSVRRVKQATFGTKSRGNGDGIGRNRDGFDGILDDSDRESNGRAPYPDIPNRVNDGPLKFIPEFSNQTPLALPSSAVL